MDEEYALRMFLEKTLAQAEAMFREQFSLHWEDLTYMRAPAFRFYLPAAIKYLLSEDANGDADAASTFCYVLESRLARDPAALIPIAPAVEDAIQKILANFDRFECSPEAYGDVPSRYKALADKLVA